MAFNWLYIAVVASFALIIRGDENAEPRVAFLCGFPSMYSTQQGKSWVKDDNTGCLKDPVDVLNYCRKVYPTLDIRNVVESTEKVTISNWCDFGVSICNKEITVTPFRCLVGSFQSDALLVPEHCIFDHIHDSQLCSSFGAWNRTAVQSCVERGMVQQSFAMLQPCGIDKFSGVEFVCCPAKQAVETKDISETSVEQKQEKQPDKPVVLAAGKPIVKDQDDLVLSAMGRYIQRRGREYNEHDYFVKAKDNMQKHHHDKIAKMMTDWAAARQRIQQLRATDPKQGETLNKEVTSRFQKMYEAEEVESEMEAKQLKQLHQQRVQSDIIERKEEAFDDYVNALGDSRADASEILKSLKRYIKTLHKDRMHTINHYEHLEDTDPEQADDTHLETAQHIRLIDQQLADAVNMLSRVPGLKNKIKHQIKVFIEAYHSLDRDAAVILLTQPAHKEKQQDKHEAGQKYSSEESGQKYSSEDSSSDSKSNEHKKINKKEAEKESDDWSENDDDDEYDDDESYDDDEDMEDERVFEVPAVKPRETMQGAPKDGSEDERVFEVPAVKPRVTMQGAPKDGSEVAVDYHHLPGTIKDRHGDAANVDKHVFAIDQTYIVHSARSADSTGLSSAVPLAIAVGTLTVIAIIIVGVVISRRHRGYSRPLRLNLDPLEDEEASPEERHVASMQMNGYVNPTYKFFEQKSSSA